MSGQEYYNSNPPPYGQPYGQQPQYQQQSYGGYPQQPAYPSQHQYPNAYPPQQEYPPQQGQHYPNQSSYGYTAPPSDANQLAPYGDPNDPRSSSRQGSHSPAPYGSSSQPGAFDPNDPNAMGPDGERGLGTKLAGGLAAGAAMHHFGHGGIIKTAGAALMGAIFAEKGKEWITGHRGLDANGNEIPGAGNGYPGPQPQQYGQPPYGGQPTGAYPGASQQGYGQGGGQYPGQPDYSGHHKHHHHKQ